VIVWLASFPRSGNTMLRILLRKVYGHPSHSLYDERPAGEGEESFAGVMGSAGQVTERDLDALRRGPGPCFVKTHEGPRDDSPALCLVRDGRDVLVSYAHFVQAYEPATAGSLGFHELLRMLIGSREHFGGWSDNVRAWYTRAGGRTAWLRYEDLLGEPLGPVEGALRRLGVELPARGASPVDFASLHARWPEFFRRGTTGTWRDEMTDELHELFWQHHHEAMRWFGYHRADGRPRR
jgi:hypothetical protein